MTCLLGEDGVALNYYDLGPELLSPGEGGALLPIMNEVIRFIKQSVGD